MGKGSNTTSTSNNSITAPDSQAAGLYRQILDRASGVASTPYQAYTGELTAGQNAQQNLGVGTANAAAGFANPYISRAAELAGSSVAPVGDQDLIRYYDPYQQRVIDATTAQLTHDFGQQHAQLQGNQIAQGALGGNATGVAKGILAGQQARTLASTTAGLQSQGFQNAVQAAQADKNRGLQGANAFANYGISGANAGLQAAQLQYGLGAQQQATEQARLNALYQQYAQAQAYPYQQTQWLAGMATGVGSNLGGTSSSTGTSTGPQPNQLGQWIGTGLTGAGLFLSDRDAKTNIEKIGKTNDGQNIYRYQYRGSPEWHIGLIAQEVDDEHTARGGDGYEYVDLKGATDDAVERASGGSVQSPWGGTGGGVVGWIPQIGIHAGQGAPGVGGGGGGGGGGQQGGGFDPTKMAEGLVGVGKGLQKKLGWGDYGSGTGAGEWYGPSSVGGAPLSGYEAAVPSSFGGVGAMPYADGGAVLGDYDPPGGVAGQQFAAGGPYQMRPSGGQVQVINTRTGQVVYTGTHSGAANAAASMNARQRAGGGGVLGFNERFAGEPRSSAWDHFVGGARDFVGGMHDVVSGSRPRDPLATSRSLWERDRRNRYSRGGPASFVGDPVRIKDSPDSPVGEFGEDNNVTFDERFGGQPRVMERADIPVTEFGESGLDPNVNLGVVNPGSPVRMVGSTFGSEPPAGAPVVAEDEDEAPTAPGVAGRMGGAGRPPVMAFEDSEHYRNIPDAVSQPDNKGFGLGLLSKNAQTGLMAAGLGMMASRSPFLGNMVGEGGIAGLGTYARAEDRDRQIAAEAQKLSMEARKQAYDRWMGERKQSETERHNVASEANESRGSKLPALYARDAQGRIVLAPGAEEATAKLARARKVGEDGKPLTREAIRMLASRVRAGDERALVGLGRGAQGRKDLVDIQEEVARQAAAGEPIDPRARDILQNAAQQGGLKAAERTQAQIMAKLSVYGRTAFNATDIALEASKDVPRTNYPKANVAINAFRANTGDPKIRALGQALQTLSNEYARAIGGGHGTVHMQEQAERRLNEADSHEQLVAIVNMMRREILAEEAAMPAAREHIRNIYNPGGGGDHSISGERGHKPPPGPVTGASGTGMVEGRTGKINGRPVVVKGGKLIYSDTGEAAQ